MSKTPKFTDFHRFPHVPYSNEKASEEPGYLAAKFDAIRLRLAKDAAEAKAKVQPMRKAGK